MEEPQASVDQIAPAIMRNLLLLQIQAFLEAAEDVDVEPETLQDLVNTIPDDEELSLMEDPTDEGIDVSGLVHESQDMEVDLSALFAAEQDPEDPESWTKQQVNAMLQYLKEHGMTPFIQKYVVTRGISIPRLLKAFGIRLGRVFTPILPHLISCQQCPELLSKNHETMLYFLRVAMSRELRLRDKLPQYNTIDDAVDLIRRSQRILILTGAGISVSCGIPDFRSKDGVYASLGQYQLDDPQQMFDISYFRENPSVFYSFATQIYPSNFTPSPCHRFIKLIEDKGKLLRNYTQNIDTLETLAGVQRVLQCHGSFATASCLQCRRRVPGSEIEADILRRKVPICEVCKPSEPVVKQEKGKKKKKKKGKDKWDSDVEDESDGEPAFPAYIMKPDITFFGEKLSDEFDVKFEQDRPLVDLLLVIGTSLKVAPVADILSHLPHSIPQILINMTPVRHINPDIVLLGPADDIVRHLCHELDWELPPPVAAQTVGILTTTSSDLPFAKLRGNLKKRASSFDHEVVPPKRVGNSHVWLFDGADGGKWLQDFEATVTRPEQEQNVETPTPPHAEEPRRMAKKQKV